MIHEIGEEHFADPKFQEAYGFGLDLWGDVLEGHESGDGEIILVMAQSIREDLASLFGYTEGDAELIMQRSFRDIAEAKGLIQGE